MVRAPKADRRDHVHVRAGLAVVTPLALFLCAFMLGPLVHVVVRAFFENGHFTLKYFAGLLDDQFLAAFQNSILVAGLSALIGGMLGIFITQAALSRGAPKFVRAILSTYCGVASYFGGVPLAFAFISILGTQGLVTQWLSRVGIDIYSHGFSLTGILGLTLIYVYFETALMVVAITPILQAMKIEWRDAAASVGATTTEYWWYVGIPVITPSVIASMLLLFSNAIAAYSSAYALTSGKINLVTIQIGGLFNGELGTNPGQASALSLGIMLLLTLTLALYVLAQRRAERWFR